MASLASINGRSFTGWQWETFAPPSLTAAKMSMGKAAKLVADYPTAVSTAADWRDLIDAYRLYPIKLVTGLEVPDVRVAGCDITEIRRSVRGAVVRARFQLVLPIYWFDEIWRDYTQ